MLAADEPNVASNDETILQLACQAGIVVAAWGVHGNHCRRGDLIKARLSAHGIPVYCLGRTKDGHPRHPLYMRKDLIPVLFEDTKE